MSFFDISFQSLNLLSFILGIFYAACQSMYNGKTKSFIIVVMYVSCVAAWFAVKAELTPTAKPQQSISIPDKRTDNIITEEKGS